MREGKKLKDEEAGSRLWCCDVSGAGCCVAERQRLWRRVPLSSSPLTFSSSSFIIVIFRVYRHVCLRANAIDAQAQSCYSLWSISWR
jgi:hypothetical protein